MAYQRDCVLQLVWFVLYTSAEFTGAPMKPARLVPMWTYLCCNYITRNNYYVTYIQWCPVIRVVFPSLLPSGSVHAVANVMVVVCIRTVHV